MNPTECVTRSPWVKTVDEVLEMEIPHPPIPESKRCRYCKRDLKPLAMIAPIGKTRGQVSWWNTSPCTCSEAQRAREREEALLVERIHEEQREQRLTASGIPARFSAARIDSLGESRVQDVAWRFVRSRTNESAGDGWGLYIVGSVGVGKTHLAAAIANALTETVSVKFASMGGLLREVRNSYDTDSATEQEIIDSLIKPDVLIIDDLGKESVTDWALQMLFSIVNARYESVKPLIVTTQYTSTELIEHLSRGGDLKTAEAIVSRLHACTYRLLLEGKDRRIA